MPRLTRRQATEACAAWTILLYRVFAAPGALWLDWIAVFGAYWIFCVFGQGTKAWAPVTALAAAWLAALHLSRHLPHALRLWGFAA